MGKITAALVVGIAGCFLTASPCLAQAWLPEKGEGTVSATFQRVSADGHFLDDGSKSPGYRTRATNMLVNVSYGITNRLAVSLNLPFVNVKYLGPEEPFNLPQNTLDDGTYHGTVSDLGFDARYNALDRPFFFTPFFAANIPSHNYKTIGEAAPGRNFQEFRLGGHVARLLDPVLPRGFVQGTYSYTFVRQDVHIPLNYSNFELLTGYFINPSIAVNFIWRRGLTHGGLTFDELFVATPDILRNFDRVVRSDFHHIGVGGDFPFPLSESVSVHANWVKFVAGRDAHFGYAFSVGLSWRFQTRRAQDVPLIPIKGK